VEPVPALTTARPRLLPGRGQDLWPWPWRASLANADLAATWNRANLLLPSKSGEATVRLHAVVPHGTARLRVTLLRDALEHDTREVQLPDAL
jgi:hypothetical protein